MTFDDILSSLQSLLGYEFKDWNLLLQSIITRSRLNDTPQFKHYNIHQDAFETLGDAVLDVLVIEKAFLDHLKPFLFHCSFLLSFFLNYLILL